jgi:membrane protease YdiL (CAAX protease family)
MLVMLALAVFLVQRGIYLLRPDAQLGRLVPIIVSAAGASVIEELLFRGALLGLLRRSLKNYTALFFVSALYSAVHFIQPHETDISPNAVNFFSGFALLPDVFWRFTQPAQVLGGFMTLFVLGWILGFATIKTRALWCPIGIHAGCIVGKFSFGKIAKSTGDRMPWFGKDLVTGFGPLFVLGAMGLIVWAWLNFADVRADQKNN